MSNKLESIIITRAVYHSQVRLLELSDRGSDVSSQLDQSYLFPFPFPFPFPLLVFSSSLILLISLSICIMRDSTGLPFSSTQINPSGVYFRLYLWPSSVFRFSITMTSSTERARWKRQRPPKMVRNFISFGISYEFLK